MRVLIIIVVAVFVISVSVDAGAVSSRLNCWLSIEKKKIQKKNRTITSQNSLFRNRR